MTERARGLGRKNKKGDRKGESNDSPEIPDRRRISDIPGLPSGANGSNKRLFILTQTHSMQIFGEIPFIKPQNDT